MRIIVTLLLLLTFTDLLGQKRKCNIFLDKAKKEWKAKEPDYPLIIKQLNAYKACDLSKTDTVNFVIEKINAKIIAQRDFARAETKRANLATLKAIKEANRATALYWASESDKLNPIQGIRLLQEAIKIDSSQQFVHQQLIKLFNESFKHEFREKERIEGARIGMTDNRFNREETNSSPSNRLDSLLLSIGDTIPRDKRYWHWINLPDAGKWMLVYNDTTKPEQKVRVLETSTGNSIHFLKSDKIYYDPQLSPNSKWLLIRYGEFSYANFVDSVRIWEVLTGNSYSVINRAESYRSIFFSPDSKWIVLAGEKVRIWNVESHKFQLLDKLNEAQLGAHEWGRYPRFSSDSKWFYLWGEFGSNNKSSIWELESGKVPTFLDRETSLRGLEISSDSKWLMTANNNFKDGFFGTKIYQLKGGVVETISKLKIDTSNYYFEAPSHAIFSSDGNWVTTITFPLSSGKYSKLKFNVKTGRTSDSLPPLLVRDNDNRLIDSLTERFNNSSKICSSKLKWSVYNDNGSLVVRNELRNIIQMTVNIDEQIYNIKFSKNEDTLFIITEKKIFSFHLTSRKKINSLTTTGYIIGTHLLENNSILLVTDEVIIKFDTGLKGDYFTYGFKEGFDYQYYGDSKYILKWIKLYEHQYLLPLSVGMYNKYIKNYELNKKLINQVKSQKYSNVKRR